MGKYLQMAKDAEARRLLSELQGAGYRFTLSGDSIRFTWTAEGKPDPAIFQRKFDRLKELKAEAIMVLLQQQGKLILFEEARKRIRERRQCKQSMN